MPPETVTRPNPNRPGVSRNGLHVDSPSETFQASLLAGVSRTFALTIPQLPAGLRHEVGNAYLLCRILDTIEDEPGLSPKDKSRFFARFRELVEKDLPADTFAHELADRLTSKTLPAEHDLVRKCPRVLRITHGFTTEKKAALVRCVNVMSHGMDQFQSGRSDPQRGLSDLEEMNRYCYFVAGVVGEMLTDLFCAHSPQIAAQRHRMLALAPGFGQGLQMTNILKDIHEDSRRSACWLPRDVFDGGVPGKNHPTDENRECFEEGMRQLVGFAHGNLKQALEYTLCIPANETGIRKFCLWAIGMAMLTLRKIHRNPNFSRGAEVKISRKSVKATIALTHVLVRRDRLLRPAFSLASRGLPLKTFHTLSHDLTRFESSPDSSGSTPRTTSSPRSVEEAIAKAARTLRNHQSEEGYWCFDFEADGTIPAEYILFMHFEGEVDRELQERMARYLRRRQGKDGGWPLYYEGRADLSCSVKTYYALKLAGDDPEVDHMRRACQCILAMGGAARANVFTRLTLAIFGQVPWRAVPYMPVEILLLPKWFPFHLSKVAYWSRTVMVPFFVLYSYRARARNPTGIGIPELFITPPHIEKDYFPVRSRMNRLLLAVERTARRFEWMTPSFLHRRATERAMRWISDRLNGDHGLGAIFPAMVNACEALIVTGVPPEDSRRKRARKALDDLVIRQGDEAYCQPCVSPVWDTALSALALQETGRDEDREAAARGLDWLKERQLLEFRGDWSEARPELPGGGWPFQFKNSYYPDLDDTALVAYAMFRHDPERYRQAIDRATTWLAGLQSKNGGFASFEVDNTQVYLNEIPFADHGALLDPPTADVSARCAMLFGAVGEQDTRLRESLNRVLVFLSQEQEQDGSWFGRWGTNYIYGTWSVLVALEQCSDRSDIDVAKAVAWLEEKQRADGGWGETNDSYEDSSLRGVSNRSTAFQTAWALLGLMAAGKSRSEAVAKGVKYLLEHQSEDGWWYDPEFTCPGFPRVFYLKYHGYDKFFPLWALARYQSEMHAATAKRVRAAVS